MILKVIVLLLSFVNAGYMTFDGCKALLTGDYVRPSSGKYAGQLGPWSKIAEAVGLDPMSTGMKSIFLILGFYVLIASVRFAMNHKYGWILLMIFCIGSIWNLMFGTMSSLICIVLLFIYKAKFL